MLIIPTPEEASSYAAILQENPDLAPVLEALCNSIERSQGRSTWVDQCVVPSHLFATVKLLLARKFWHIEYGYTEEERYHYYSLTPTTCICCRARSAGA